ncbi:MAG: DUF928 domain-containing protein [Xenococcaceae cyanobacterium MO_188.B29]|nr:DUF928 domain-containing protein [Xenococcaceae cyanobacterium MO_188.B29]
MSKKTIFKKGLITLVTAISLFISLAKYSAITAQSQNLSNNKQTISFNPPKPEDNGAPAGSREGAGSHGLCKLINQEKDIAPLIAIIPEVAIKTATKNKKYIWGETTSAYPTFWFYVAYPVNSQVEFILQDEAENEIYNTIFTLDKTDGIISLHLPQDKVNLETGKSYHWYLYVMCNPENSPDDFVEGWVKRVELSSEINHKSESAQSLELISIYAENGLWFDTLNSIDRLRQAEPENKNYSAVWTNLLQQIGLEKISRKPIIK